MTATLPGSEQKWKELAVSEFRVLGHPNGAPENLHHLPAMAIGSLDGVTPHQPPRSGEPPAGPFATLNELCAAYDRVMAGPSTPRSPVIATRV